MVLTFIAVQWPAGCLTVTEKLSVVFIMHIMQFCIVEVDYGNKTYTCQNKSLLIAYSDIFGKG